MATNAVRVQVLGSTRAWHAGTELPLGPPGRRAVLGLLVLAEGESVTVADLVDALWGERPPRSAMNVLQTHVKHLRRVLEPGRTSRTSSSVLPYTNGGYAVNADAVEVDLLAFRRLVAEANHGDTGSDGDRTAVVARLAAALELWRGRPLADVPVLAAHPKVVALVAKHREVQARYADAMIEIGAAADVLPDIAEAAAAQPLDEAAQARLIRAYQAVGRRAKAFRTYHEVRDRLVEELGVDPGPELRAAHTALLHDTADDPVDGRSRPALRVPRQLPAQPSGFTGRGAQLATLDALAPGPGSVALSITAISGSAGVGKTALAVHWAHRVRDRFPDGQLYANLRGHSPGGAAPPIEVLAQFLTALEVPAERVPVDVETAAAMYRTLTTDRRMLVLLDNAAGPDQVRPLLPAGPACVLVTGRDRMTGLVALHGARQVTLGVLSPEDALELLAHVLGRERVRAEPVAAAELAKLCAYLPLALRIAAANLADHPHRGLDDHVADLRDSNVLTALTVQGDENAAVRTAFDLSYAALPEPARRLFRLLSLVPGTDVGTEAVAALAGTDRETAARLMDRLAAAHLVEPRGPGRHGFHDLLRRYAAERAGREETAGDRDAALHRLHDWYLGAVDAAARLLYPHMLRLPVPPPTAATPSGMTGAGEASAWLDAELANLVAAVRAGPRPAAWLIADSLRGYFWMCTRQVEWLAVAEAALPMSDAPRERAAARLSLADLFYRQGRYGEAVRHYTHARLAAREAGWVEAQAAVLGNLGGVYWQSGRLRAAAVRFRRCLALSRAVGQPAGEAVALGNLGLVHWEMGDLPESAEHYARALRRYREIGSLYGEALNLGNLGQTQRARGLPEEAAEVLTRAIALHHEAGNRSGEALARSRLAAAFLDLGRDEEALGHARAGLALAQETGDPRTEVEALAALAAVELGLGRPAEAGRRYRQALDLVRSTGDRYPEIEVLIGLATVTRDAAPARQALALAERAGYRALHRRAESALAALTSR
ncbi:DNA-binding transcriptional activator of the SARP family [Lentzea fradiae]|uniref:DNA-binding transcriptional activator of the SARP family n=1 Tax=Lentzea fradiae TaxID=200378 RepID=A0A1G7KC76_9PSEU|nr:BTAD domain-containing putative transcriptional regulator [Lentzea fradiae]SDF34785.1 DNA-binding transcriptional activator of the SARP family [Lentzea fradiae]